jgi:hypothetical protein
MKQGKFLNNPSLSQPMKQICKIRNGLFPTMVALTIQAFSSSALIVGWQNGMTISPGDGVLLSQQRQPAPAGAGLVSLSANGTLLNDGWQSEHVTFAQHFYDMVKTLSINTSVSLESLTYGNANLGLNFLSKQTFTATNLTFVFTKTRNFGTTLYNPLGFCQPCGTFVSTLPLYQQNFSGEALHARITSQFGTHYVAGVQRAAWLWVAYSFNYSSATVKQSLSVTASGSSWDSASFSAFVDAFFRTTNTSVSMSYQSASSSKHAPPFSKGIISNFQQFTNFVTQLEGYVNSLNDDDIDAQTTGYVLYPLQTIPGYLSLLGGYVPTAVDPAEYGDFLRVYTALQVWDQRLAPWKNMSWLNAQGRQVVTSKWQDADSYLTAMGTIASNHFNAGTALYVPNDVVAYLANLSDLTLPTIYSMDNFHYQNGVDLLNYQCFVGRVDSGCRALTILQPFSSLTLLHNQISVPPATNIDYDAYHFQTNLLAKFPSGGGNSALITHLQTLFTNQQWACLTNESTNPDRTGYFFVRVSDSSAPASWNFEITDGSGGSGILVDKMNMVDTRSGGCGAPDQTPGMANVTLASVSAPATGLVGVAQPVTVQVTNNGPFQAYGTTVSFVLSNGFEFGGASGTQGSGSFDPTTRMVSYAVGPLHGGARAGISFQLIPVQTGSTVPGSLPALGLGTGLVNSAPTNTSPLPPVQATPQLIGYKRVPAGILLDSWSDSDRVLVASSAALGSGASWHLVTNGVPAVNGNHRFLSVSPAGPQNFFQLGIQ